MQSAASITQRGHPAQPPLVWPTWILDTILTILFLGPILSPLLRATDLPLVADTGLLARDMLATFICPTPAQSYAVAGSPMAVCARCWGATIGLWVARGMLRPALHAGGGVAALLGRFRALPWTTRLMLCMLPFMLWPLEIAATTYGWWAFPPLELLLFNGAQAGFAAGLFFSSVWPGFWAQPARS